jgi:ATP-dependent Lon protease
LPATCDKKDGVNIMKGYMESGEFSRGRESIRADGGIVLVGNVDVEHQQAYTPLSYGKYR